MKQIEIVQTIVIYLIFIKNLQLSMFISVFSVFVHENAHRDQTASAFVLKVQVVFDEMFFARNH